MTQSRRRRCSARSGAWRIGSASRGYVLCSYSPASCINSFLDESGIVSLKAGSALRRLCVPLMRPARRRFLHAVRQPGRVRAPGQPLGKRLPNELTRSFSGIGDRSTRLMPPYTTLDLAEFTALFDRPEQYRPMERSRVGWRYPDAGRRGGGDDCRPRTSPASSAS